MSKAAALLLSIALLACSTPPAPRAAIPEPTLPTLGPPGPHDVQDARTGLRVAVPVGWHVAPPAMIEATRPPTWDPPNRHLFTLVDDLFLQTINGNRFVVIAVPLELAHEVSDAETFCRWVAGDVAVNFQRVELESILRIDRHDVCAIRSRTHDDHPAFHWFTRAGAELIVLSAVDVTQVSETAIKSVGRSLRFAPPSEPEPEIAEPEPVVEDPRTGLRFQVPRGWWLLPDSFRRHMLLLAALEQGFRERWSFSITRMNVLPGAPELLTYVVEGLPPGGTRPKQDAAGCAQLVELMRKTEPNTEPLPSRAIGGLTFCSYRTGDEGAIPHRVFSSVRGDYVVRFLLYGPNEDVAALEALLDTVRFE